MSPFRNELEASHARIAQLETEKAALEQRNAELVDRLTRRDRRPRKLRARRRIMMAMIMAGLAVSAALFISGYLDMVSPFRRLGLASHEYSSDGIAIAPLPQPPPAWSAPPSPQARPAAPEGQKTSTWCGCTPGDPLCTCIPPLRKIEPRPRLQNPTAEPRPGF